MGCARRCSGRYRLPRNLLYKPGLSRVTVLCSLGWHRYFRYSPETIIDASKSTLSHWSYPVLEDRFRFEFQDAFSIFPLVIDG